MYRFLLNYIKLMIFAFAILFLSACVDDSKVAIDTNDTQLVEGKKLYENNCSSCHGLQGEGRLGPQLSDNKLTNQFPNPDDQAELIKSGKSSMPGFDSVLSESEIEAVVRYTREVISPIKS